MHAVAGSYRRVLPNGLVIASARAEHAAQLESLQRVVFPTLADEERFKAAHYLKHFELFPDGQFVGLDGDRVVAATATIRLHFDFDRSLAHLRRHHPGRLADLAPTGRRLAVRRRYRRAPRVSRQRTGPGAVRRTPGTGVDAGTQGAGHRGHDERLRRRQAPDERRGLLRRARRRPNQRPHALHAAARGIRVPRRCSRTTCSDPVCDNYSVLIVLDAARDVEGAVRPGAAREPSEGV